jgi:hypothetical protein
LRHDGWTPDKQRQFIEQLADCGIVKEAAGRVGMTERSAYRLRRRPDAAGFNRAWDAAVQFGVDRLHSTAFERAIEGTVRQRWFQGEVIGEERIFDNRLLIYLLGRLDKQRGQGVRDAMENWDASMGALEDGLARPLPAPEADYGAPVWRDEDGEWWTDLAPPEDFEGDQCGYFGEEDYCRGLSSEELEAVEAWQASVLDRGRLRRQRYFARLITKVSPEVQPTSSRLS